LTEEFDIMELTDTLSPTRLDAARFSRLVLADAEPDRPEDETLVLDRRAGLSPAEMVETKLLRLQIGTVLSRKRYFGS
jgi:hypothetical protein